MLVRALAYRLLIYLFTGVFFFLLLLLVYLFLDLLLIYLLAYLIVLFFVLLISFAYKSGYDFIRSFLFFCYICIRLLVYSLLVLLIYTLVYLFVCLLFGCLHIYGLIHYFYFFLVFMLFAGLFANLFLTRVPVRLLVHVFDCLFIWLLCTCIYFSICLYGLVTRCGGTNSEPEQAEVSGVGGSRRF